MQWQSAFSDVRVATRLFPNDFGEDLLVVIISYFMILQLQHFMALNSSLCADVPLGNCSVAHSLCHSPLPMQVNCTEHQFKLPGELLWEVI